MYILEQSVYYLKNMENVNFSGIYFVSIKELL